MERRTDLPEVAQAVIEGEAEEKHLTYEEFLRMYNLN